MDKQGAAGMVEPMIIKIYKKTTPLVFYVSICYQSWIERDGRGKLLLIYSSLLKHNFFSNTKNMSPNLLYIHANRTDSGKIYYTSRNGPVCLGHFVIIRTHTRERVNRYR